MSRRVEVPCNGRRLKHPKPATVYGICVLRLTSPSLRRCIFHQRRFIALMSEEKRCKFEEFHASELYGGYGAFEGIDQDRRLEAITKLLHTLTMCKLAIVYGTVTVCVHLVNFFTASRRDFHRSFSTTRLSASRNYSVNIPSVNAFLIPIGWANSTSAC